jgi:hypothetical protein
VQYRHCREVRGEVNEPKDLCCSIFKLSGCVFVCVCVCLCLRERIHTRRGADVVNLSSDNLETQHDGIVSIVICPV